jgi:hypothetical protein
VDTLGTALGTASVLEVSLLHISTRREGKIERFPLTPEGIGKCLPSREVSLLHLSTRRDGIEVPFTRKHQKGRNRKVPKHQKGRNREVPKHQKGRNRGYLITDLLPKRLGKYLLSREGFFT